MTGGFTQEDPIGYAGGINLYGYVGNNPVSYSDPYGLCPTCGPAAAAAVAVGGIRLVGNLLTGRPVLENVGRDALIAGAAVLTLGAALPVAAAATSGSGLGVAAAETGGAGLSKADVGALREFFGRGLEGAAERGGNFRIPDGLSREALGRYGQLARDAIEAGKDKLGVQAARLQLVEKALEELEKK